jgi:hypothetical protein
MGVIIKYLLKFPEVGLKVSNDVFSGDFVIDAAITATTLRGAAGSSFEIKLYDLPQKKAQEIEQKLRDKQPVSADISLGYFDDAFGRVMTGAVTQISSVVSDDKLVTTIKGEESATHALKRAKPGRLPPSEATIEQAVNQLLEQAEGAKVDIALRPQLQDISSKPLKDKSWRNETVMQALDEVAEITGAELLVSDKKIWLGKPIENDGHTLELKAQVNLAAFQPFTKEIPEETELNILKKLTATDASGFKFTMVGDPKARSGQKVEAQVEDFAKPPAPEFRVHSLVHKLSTSAGYVCEGVALKTEADDNCRRREAAACQHSPEKIAETLTGKAKAEGRRHPVIEIGEVQTYSAEKHQGTLFFNQPFEKTETQPSIRAPVDHDDQKLLRNKPLVSPFAWHKCGLIVPVYAGMKALLAHNLALQDDALVTGFIWSETPAIEPPTNKEGDWWLCLPIDFDASKPPADDTKAANDLTANNGKRVIEVKGLKITIGAEKLANVGTRPSEGQDDEFLIEHKKARIKISADGNIEMTADADGGVVFKITKSSIEIA